MVGLLLLVGLLVVVVSVTRQVRDRAAWLMYRVRLAPGGDRAALDAQFLGLCHQAGGGEVWAIREGGSMALVVVVPAAWGPRVQALVERLVPGSHVAPVRQLAVPPSPRWCLVTPAGAPAAPWPYGLEAGFVVISLTRGGRALVLAADATSSVGQAARSTPLPIPALLRRHILGLLRVGLRLPGAAQAVVLPLFPDPAHVAGAALPVLPPLPTTVRDRPGGVLRLGQAGDGAPLTLPLNRSQAIEIVGGLAERRPLLVHTLRSALDAHAALVALVSPAVADALVAQAGDAGDRLRVVDYRAMAKTATLDLAALSDAQLTALLDQLMAFDPRDAARRLTGPALRHWRQDAAPLQFGLLLARLFDPSPEVCGLAAYEDGGDSYFDWRTYGNLWQMRAQPYLSRSLLGLLAAPGEQLPALLAAGGGLIVVQPPKPAHRRALQLILAALVAALPALGRPLVLATEGDGPQDRLAVPSHAAVWTSLAWSDTPAWRLVTGGMTGKTLPPAVRALVGHPLALSTLTDRWLVCGPELREVAVMLPSGLPLPISSPPVTPALPPREHQAAGADLSLSSATPAAVQTAVGALRRVGCLRESLTAIEYVLAHPAKRVPTRVIEGGDQREQTIEVVLRTPPPSLATNLADYLAASAETNLEAVWGMRDGDWHHLLLTVRDPRPPAVRLAAVRLCSPDGDERFFLWDRLSHLLVTGPLGVTGAQAVVIETLTSVPADQCSLLLLGALPPELASFATAPHATRLPIPPARWETMALEEQIDAVLAAQLAPDADGRLALIVALLPATLSPALGAAVMRLLQRAHHRPLVFLGIVLEPNTTLVPFTRLVPVLGCPGPIGTLTLGQARYPWRIPGLRDAAALADDLATLPVRTQVTVVETAPDPASFWQVAEETLAPAVGVPPVDSAAETALTGPTATHPAEPPRAPAMVRATAHMSPPAPPAQLDAGLVQRLLRVGLADSRRQLTARMVTNELREYALADSQAWGLLAALFEQSGVLINRQGGRGAYRIDPALVTDAAVWERAAERLGMAFAVPTAPDGVLVDGGEQDG